MKSTKYLLGFFMSAILFLALTVPNNVLALALNFDKDGASNNEAVYTLIDTLAFRTPDDFYIQQYATPSGSNTELGNGDVFTELYTARIGSAKLGGFEVATYGEDLWLTIQLAGVLANYSPGPDGLPGSLSDVTRMYDDTYTVQFTSGSASIYFDTGNDDSGLIQPLADLDFVSGFIDDYTPNPGNRVSDINIQFKFSQIYDDAFLAADSSSLDDLVSNGWLLAFTTGSVDIQGVTAFDADGNGTNDYFVIQLQDNGFTADFHVVPEPATMLLLGSGLLGLAVLGRKKNFFKKD